MNDADLQTPQLYINRELSFLEFNQRVLEQAKDSRIPSLAGAGTVASVSHAPISTNSSRSARRRAQSELLEAGAVQGRPLMDCRFPSN